MKRCRRFAASLLLGLLCGWPALAEADNSIEQIVPKTLTPAPGSVVTFQIAVTPNDNTVWNAGSYTLSVIAVDPGGATLVESAPFTGDAAATPQQTTMIFVDLSLPQGFIGPLVVHAHLVHDKTTEDSTPVSIVVGGAPLQATVVPGASPPPGQIPAPSTAVATTPAPAPPPAQVAAKPPNWTGSIALNAGFAALQSQSGVLNLSGKLGAADSVTMAAGLANNPGVQKPILTLQSPTLLVEAGTFAPAFDRDAFAGPSGSGIGFKQVWGTTHSLQGAFISGNHDTTNPFQMEGLAYGFPLLGSQMSVTGGYENITGPAQPGPFFLRNGAFFGFGDDVRSPNSSFTYGVHYGLTLFHDDVADVDQMGDAWDLTLGFAIRKAQFAFTYVRASPFFANASAPGITPDKEIESGSVTVPVGVFQVTIGANAYRDDLPDSQLLQTTHYATENIGISYPLKNGDTLSFQAVNGVQHQTGDPIAPFSGNDGTTFAYTTKRGPYAFQYTLADTETRDNSNDLLHVITNGITVSRSPFAGITISGGFNLNQNDANVSSETMLSNSVTGSVSWTLGELTVSSQINHALSHPYVGLSSPPTTTYNYGVSVKPPHSPYSVTGSVTENIGMMNSAVGALSLNRQF